MATSTGEADVRATFAIYELAGGATDPTEGNLLARFSRNYEHGGFHRVDLDTPVTIGADRHFFVTSAASPGGEDGPGILSICILGGRGSVSPETMAAVLKAIG